MCLPSPIIVKKNNLKFLDNSLMLEYKICQILKVRKTEVIGLLFGYSKLLQVSKTLYFNLTIDYLK